MSSKTSKRSIKTLPNLDLRDLRVQDLEPISLPQEDEYRFKERASLDEEKNGSKISAARVNDLESDLLESVPPHHSAHPNLEESLYADINTRYPPPFDIGEVHPRMRSVFPYSAIGKLVMKFDGKYVAGTAALVSERIAITAGHCIFDPARGGDVQGATFISSYEDNTPSYELGRWSVKFAKPHPRWKSTISKPSARGDRRFDIGMLLLRKDRYGRTAGSVCGQLGLAFNRKRAQHWKACGYPQLAPFDGGDLFEVSSSYAYGDKRYGTDSPVGIGCSMTQGCSGGPWLLNLRASSYPPGSNLINGISSYRRTGKNMEMLSPYFGDAAKKFIMGFIKEFD